MHHASPAALAPPPHVLHNKRDAGCCACEKTVSVHTQRLVPLTCLLQHQSAGSNQGSPEGSNMQQLSSAGCAGWRPTCASIRSCSGSFGSCCNDSVSGQVRTSPSPQSLDRCSSDSSGDWQLRLEIVCQGQPRDLRLTASVRGARVPQLAGNLHVPHVCWPPDRGWHLWPGPCDAGFCGLKGRHSFARLPLGCQGSAQASGQVF